MSHRIYAEISLAAIRSNIRRAKELAGRPLCAVVKADAYGHGAEAVAALCEQESLRYLAVATADEALSLRAAGIAMPLLVLGYTPPYMAVSLVQAHVTQTIYDLEQAGALSDALPRDRQLQIHIKADTGMNRLGLKTAEDIARAAALPGLRGEGLFTHFATADCPGDPYVREQSERFMRLVEDLRKKNVEFTILHCENSGAVVNYRELFGNMVRTGLILYGHAPRHEDAKNWRPAMRLIASIAQIKHLDTGDTVSYGRTFTAPHPMDIAVLCCGYADGYHRSLSGKAHVLIGGQRAPIVGSICMDMMMADVSGIPSARAGGRAVLFGTDGDASISLWELAPLADTIPYELLCSVSARVPRVYVKE